MRILIEGKTVLLLPNSILKTRKVKKIVSQYLLPSCNVPGKAKSKAISKDVSTMMSVLVKISKQYKGFVLVDIVSHDNRTVQIVL